MFSHHEIVSLAKRTKVGHRKCSLHKEPYIMFSTENKSIICIKCFRQAVKELQAREAIIMLRAMIGEVCSNMEEEENAICNLFNSIQVHLVTCSAFLSSANKFECLDMGYINTDYRCEFARCLEPLLLLGQRRPAPSPGQLVPQPLVVVVVVRSEESQNLKDQLQELHRDLTKYHSLINTDTMDEILDRSLHIDGQINQSIKCIYKALFTSADVTSQYCSVENMRTLFEEIWEETFQRDTNEQEIYEAQLHDLQQLKQENSDLTTIAQHFGPYILSIAKIKECLEPR
ncbi:unnamed protein product [Coregonus sp. 'balchen']|nr:unnamed protein product [Coregonus sp. 'balchen']